MVHVITSNQRHRQDFGWLDARWHFSFGDYHDPTNMNFGPLRVFNDDLIHPGGKFGMHPHKDMEIVSYVVRGSLEHGDHLGNRGVVKPGEVQVMSAGTGITHSEANGGDETTRLLQIWILPRTKGNPPRYDQKTYTPADRTNRLLAVASGQGKGDALPIDQDATIYVTKLEAGKSVTHTAGPGRRAYVFAITGSSAVNGTPLAAGDQARLSAEPSVTLAAGVEAAEVMLIDLPA